MRLKNLKQAWYNFSMLNELRKIFTPNGVLSKKEDLYPYAFDSSPNSDEIILPKFVVFPKNKTEVCDVVKLAGKNNCVIIARGAGTCHCGGCRPKGNRETIVVHFSRMNKILNIDRENLIANLEPNVVIGDFQQEVEKLGLFFPPDPSNLKVSTIGGAIALSSGGPRTFKYGSIKNYVINLEVVNSKGELFKTSCDVAKNVTGYNLTQLFVGSEGGLGVIVEASVRLIPKPARSLLSLAYFNSTVEAGIAVNKIVSSSITPSVIDLLDKNTLQTIEKFNPCGLLGNYEAALLVEIDGNIASVEFEQNKISEILKNNGAKEIISAKNELENEKIWKARRSAFGSVAKLAQNVVTEDVVVPISKIPNLISGIEKLCKEYNILVCIMGHAGDGNIHPNFALNMDNEIERKNFEIVKDKLFELAISLGGTLSGEHGIGCEKKKYLNLAINQTALNYMQQIKQIFDPNGIFNTEKMF